MVVKFSLFLCSLRQTVEGGGVRRVRNEDKPPYESAQVSVGLAPTGRGVEGGENATGFKSFIQRG
jgi:hypothetical protein